MASMFPAQTTSVTHNAMQGWTLPGSASVGPVNGGWLMIDTLLCSSVGRAGLDDWAQ